MFQGLSEILWGGAGAAVGWGTLSLAVKVPPHLLLLEFSIGEPWGGVAGGQAGRGAHKPSCWSPVVGSGAGIQSLPLPWGDPGRNGKSRDPHQRICIVPLYLSQVQLAERFEKPGGEESDLT